MKIAKVHIHVVNYMIKKTQLFVDLETFQLSVDLFDVEVVREQVAVTDLMYFTHDLSSVVAQTVNVYRCLFPLLGDAFLKGL